MTDTPTSDNSMTGARVLIVEDDPAFADRLAKNLKLDGFSVEHRDTGEAALKALDADQFDLVLADVRMPGMSGLELLDEVRKADEEGGEDADGAGPPVIILTSIDEVETAVDAMRRGAADYLTKGATREEICLRLQNVMRQSKLAGEVRQLRRSLVRYRGQEEIVGTSPAMEKVREAIAEIGASNVSVLVTGETGVGKELVARALHRSSPRAAKPLVEVNCAALPDENLLLSELFGHERGAFTGAVARKRGHFELAEGGTLFLDEIGDLGPRAQAGLLRAVESLQFRRVGGERDLRVNCRLVFATNRNVEEAVKNGDFRQDLYYRINVFPIEVPPLRARVQDIPPLARFFAQSMAHKHGLGAVGFEEDALDALKANPWPGNVRELRNVVERLAIRFAGKKVSAQSLRELSLSAAEVQAGPIMLPEGGIDLQDVEKSLVIQALERSDWSQRQAADLLGISVDRMNARVKKFGLTHASWRVHKG